MIPTTPDIDEDLELWDQFITAVRWLRASGQLPTLTLPPALPEALDAWLAETAAVRHQGTPFIA